MFKYLSGIKCFQFESSGFDEDGDAQRIEAGMLFDGESSVISGE